MLPYTGVVIVAGGSGSRLGGALPKQFRLLGGRPLLARVIDVFAAALPGAPLVAVLPAGHIDFWHDLAARFDVPPHSVVAGGTERFHSVRNGLDILPADTTLIAVHDGARPLVSTDLIRRAVATAAAAGTAVPVLRPADSFRITEEEGSHPVDRTRLRAVQTPQVFDAALLRRAYRADYSPSFTDDATVVEACGHTVALCRGERRNFKITESEDLTLAEALLAIEGSGSENDPIPARSAGKSSCCRRNTRLPQDGETVPPNDFAAGGAGPIR